MKKFVLVFALLVAAFMVVACQPAPEAAEPAAEAEEAVAEETEAEEPAEAEETEAEEPAEAEEVEVTDANTLKLLYWQAASTLNPYLSGGTKDIEAASLILESLARYDEEGNLVPWLVDEIPTLENGGIAEDLTSITWTLTEGILWADGTPLTAEDVVFTGEYCMNEDMGCNAIANFAAVSSIEAVDDLTVKITFEEAKPFPYGPFVGYTAPIIQKAQFADCTGTAAVECTEQNFAPIGTGPYVATEFLANDTALYAVNENYRGLAEGKPFFKEVIFKGGGDAASAARAVLETGEADYAWNLQVEPEILASMEAAGNGALVTGFGTSVERLIVNLTDSTPDAGDIRSQWVDEDGDGVNDNPHPFLTDFNVRKALSLAIDRSMLVEAGYGQAGEIGCNILPAPAAYVSTANDDCANQDVDAANALLDEAGWVLGDDGVRAKDGVRLSILYQTSTNSVRQGTQALVKQMWEAIGVETELRNISADVFFGGSDANDDNIWKFFADIEMFTNTFDGTDPESYMGNWTCDQMPGPENQWGGNNMQRWCNEDYDALVAEMATVSAIEERAKLAKQMNDMLVQDYVMIPLVTRGDVSAVNNTLEGVRFNVWDSELWNVADWTRAE